MLLKKSTDTDALKGHGFIRAAKAFVKRAALAAEGWFYLQNEVFPRPLHTGAPGERSLLAGVRIGPGPWGGTAVTRTSPSAFERARIARSPLQRAPDGSPGRQTGGCGCLFAHSPLQRATEHRVDQTENKPLDICRSLLLPSAQWFHADCIPSPSRLFESSTIRIEARTEIN